MPRLKNEHEGYLGNPNVKKDGVESQFSEKEITEYRQCMMDPAYFAINYLKVISLDDGLVPFELYPYQKNMFNHFNENRKLFKSLWPKSKDSCIPFGPILCSFTNELVASRWG